MFDRLERLREEQRKLREEQKSLLAINKQLRSETRQHVRELHDLSSMRLKNAMQTATPLNTAIVIKFPKTVFTREELEAANPAISREDLIMQLAYRISLRELEFFPASLPDESVPSASGESKIIPFVYRVAV